MIKRSIIIQILLIFFIQFIQGQVNDLLRTAFENNQDIRAMEHNLASLERKMAASRSWPDPMLAIEYSNVPIESWRLDESPMSGIQLRLQQQLMFPGKLKAGTDIVRSEIEVAEIQLAERKNDLARKVRDKYINLQTVRSLRELTREHGNILQQMKRTIAIKYEVGSGSQLEYIRIGILEKKIADDIRSFDQKEKEILSELNAILNRDLNENVLTDPLTQPESDQLTLRLEQLDQTGNLSLRKLEQEDFLKKALRRKITLSGYPDLTVWTGYRIREDIGTMENVDLVSVGISVPLPFSNFSKTRKEIQSMDLQLLAIASSYQNRQKEIEAIITSEIAEINILLSRIELYGDELITELETALEISLDAYSTGNIDISSIYQIQFQLLDFKKTYINSLAELWKSISHLEYLTDTQIVNWEK